MLDPVQDCRAIVFLLTCYEFRWDIERALEFAPFRTYAVFRPSPPCSTRPESSPAVRGSVTTVPS